MSLGRLGEASSYYDEWWLSIILTWKHPLLFWLGVANEGCIAKLPVYPSAHFSALSFALLPSLTSLPSSLPVPVCIVGVVIRPLQHPDLMQRSAVCCFSVSVTECSRNCHGAKLVPNGSAMPATALPSLKRHPAIQELHHPHCVDIKGSSFASLLHSEEWGHWHLMFVERKGRCRMVLKGCTLGCNVVHVYLCHVERCQNCAFDPWSKFLNTEHLPILIFYTVSRQYNIHCIFYCSSV